MTAMRSTTSDLASISRAAQRKQRLLDIENEQRIEEAEALKMTEEQRQILYLSFKSVKVEFSDLDGLKWTGSALRRRKFQPLHASSSRRLPAAVNGSVAHSLNTLSKSQAFAVLTNAELALFNPEDTIRAPTTRPAQQPQHSPTHTLPSNRPHTRSPSMNISSTSFPVHASQFNYRNGTRSRSPVKGLFLNNCAKPTAELPPSDDDTHNSCEDDNDDDDDDDTRTVRGESEHSDYEAADVTITQDPGDVAWPTNDMNNVDSWGAARAVTRGRAQRPSCQPLYPPGIPCPSA